jgi:hypothetical protein
MEDCVLENTSVMEIYILYDDRRCEYLPLIQGEMDRQKITGYTLFPPVPRETVVSSINVSQKEIIRIAKEKGLDRVVIMEQDIWFPNENGWDYFVSNEPKEYDIYLAGSYLLDNRVEYKIPLTKVNSYVGHHCIIVNERYYDKFLETPEDMHIDTAQQDKGEFYLCYPMPGLQRAGFSSNNRGIVDYNKILEPIHIYGESVHTV